MAYNRKNLSGNVGAGSNAAGLFTYRDTESTKAQIAASGYFNDATDVLAKGDFILANGSNGSVVLAVTSATGAATVTTEEATLA